VYLAPGMIVGGRFVLQRQLGEGGMGVVWSAVHTVTRKAVALKMLRADRVRDPSVRQRFVREARAASAVQHPNIIEIRDVIELADGAPAMVMDLLEGESLGARLEREGALPIDVLAPIMLQVVSAVGTAHAAGVVHRDLKPDNIFLVAAEGGDAGVAVRVLDFGIAKLLPVDGEVAISHVLTNTGIILGTPYYMAPEQLFGEKGVDARADVWSLGVILYECLSGRRPTEAENVGQILRILTTGEIVPLRELAPGVPEDVLDLVDRMLQLDRALRPASLVEAHAVMARHASGISTRPFGEPATELRSLGEMPGAASPGAPPVRAVVQRDGDASPIAITLASTPASTTADRLASMLRRRRWGLVVGGAFAAVAVVAAAIVLYASARSTSRPAASAVLASPSLSRSTITADPPRPAPTVDSTPAVPPPPTAQPAAAASTTAAPARARPPLAPVHHAASAGASTPPPLPSTPRFDPYEHM
jgi:serine/threonine-protein kinase